MVLEVDDRLFLRRRSCMPLPRGIEVKWQVTEKYHPLSQKSFKVSRYGLSSMCEVTA